VNQDLQKTNPVPFIFLGAASLLLALWAGLGRLPFDLPVGMNLVMLHGPLMVGGFLGTVIAVERASAIGQRWPWIGPALTGLGTILMLGHISTGNLIGAYRFGGILFAAGGIFYTAVFGIIIRRQPTLFNWVMGLGALFFVAGNAMLAAGQSVAHVVPMWAAYLVLTITGERLELNRMLAPKKGDRALFFVALLLIVAGAVAGLFLPVLGGRLWGVGLMVMSGWLFWRDIARKTIKVPGVTRFTAICLLSGYFWLFLSGGMNMGFPGVMAGYEYDAVWHALFVGFVMTMIFGHAPIIVPALTSVLVKWRNVFYMPLVLLHVSLLMRMHGDMSATVVMRQLGGAINVVAILLFLAILVTNLQKLKRRGR
jgi:hypothetical protein